MFFPLSVLTGVYEKHPDLKDDHAKDIITGLREYFHICNVAGKCIVAMPSKVVDDAWHEFILHSREYELFCKTTFGHFLHHIPSNNVKSKHIFVHSCNIKAWEISCERGMISSTKPDKLPFLYDIDSRLDIVNGIKYSLNNNSDKNYIYVGDLSDSDEYNCFGL